MDINQIKFKTYSTLDWKRYLSIAYHPVANSFLEKHGIKVFKHAINSIKNSLKNNTDSITLFALKRSTIIIVVFKNDYVNLLNNAMEWLITKEEYEICAEIRDILIDIS
jgi:hypothetical protein